MFVKSDILYNNELETAFLNKNYIIYENKNSYELRVLLN